MIVFGGYGTYGDVKYLSLKTYTWHTVDNVKFKMAGHTANLIGKTLYIYGGYDVEKYKYSNRMHEFYTWKFENTEERTPLKDELLLAKIEKEEKYYYENLKSGKKTRE